MKARDIFGIVIRTLGVFILLHGLWYLVYAIAEACRILSEDSPGEMVSYFTAGIPATLIGMLFLRCARRIVHLSYPGDRDDSDPTA